MTSLFRKVQWWLQRRRKEEELHEELQFHLAEEKEERQADGLPADEAGWAARRELGNATLLQEGARTLWSWMLLEQLAQDVRYGVRGMFKNRMFTALAALSLALGIWRQHCDLQLHGLDPLALAARGRFGVVNRGEVASRSEQESVRDAFHGRPYLQGSLRRHRRDLPVSRVRASLRSVGASSVRPLRL